MDLEELRQARQFALSPKSLLENVGFRGIGLYSGFDLCRRLRLSTKKQGEAAVNVLVLDFAAMRDALNADKQRQTGVPQVTLTALLTEHTYFKREPIAFPQEHQFTQVLLENISDLHIHQLSDRLQLRRYLLQNLPVDFSDDFKHKQEINQQLSRNVPGYHPITIVLQSDGMDEEVVQKPAIPDLQQPVFGHIDTTVEPKVAYFWACMNRHGGRIAANLSKQASNGNAVAEGFVYKMKGFSIGDRERLSEKFTKKNLYNWYTGEIYVLDKNVVPNAERDDFEMNSAREKLDFHVGKALAQLEGDAQTFQEQRRAEELIARYLNEVNAISEEIDNNLVQKPWDRYAQLSKIAEALVQQKGNANSENKRIAEKLITRAESLKKKLQKDVDAPEPEVKRRKRVARSKRDGQSTAASQTDESVSQGKTLEEVLGDSGWAVEGEVATFVKVIQTSLDEVIGASSPTYLALLEHIEAQLSTNRADD